ncbi:MAG: cytosine methyltransferase [Firmicutes bacterium]|nr:cytosine methyltransferase [Bacillota bacterium]
MIPQDVDTQFPDIPDDVSVYYARKAGLLEECGIKPRLADLFCGAGGLSCGFGSHFGHVFQSVWATDMDEACVKTYNANFGQHCHKADIVELLEDPNFEVPQVDVVIGGPPCQGFSLLNKQRAGDPRKQLWRPYMEFVRRSGASVFVMENVPQLLDSSEYEEIKETAAKMGFQLHQAKLCAADYGAPQIRWRAFVIGSRIGDPQEAFPPKKTHKVPEDSNVRRLFREDVDEYIQEAVRWRTVRDAIGDLPAPEGIEIRSAVAEPMNLHFGRTPTAVSVRRYKSIPDEGMNRFDLQRLAPEITPACWIRKTSGGTDLFGRLWWDRPSVTIRTEFFKPEKGRYLHPVQNRPITHREAARLQSFPDKFIFTGSKVQVAKQIGNAVPCELAARVADSVMALLLRAKLIND